MLLFQLRKPQSFFYSILLENGLSTTVHGIQNMHLLNYNFALIHKSIEAQFHKWRWIMKTNREICGLGKLGKINATYKG